MRAVNMWGIRPIRPLPDRYSDADPAHINDEPSLDDVGEDSKSIITGMYRINETDPNFIDLIKASIVSKIAVGIAIGVDKNFDNWNFRNGPLDAYDPMTRRGGHWLCLVGFDGDVFRIINSWSRLWGDDGVLVATANWLKMACVDCYPFAVKMAA